MRFLALVLAISIPALSADSDTAQLAGILQPYRQYQRYELNNTQFRQIQRVFVSWIDARVVAGKTPELMNAELKAAGLLSEGVQSVDDYETNFAGYSGGVGDQEPRGAPELFALTAGIEAGSFCNLDHTILIYDRQTRNRLWMLNAPQGRFEHGFYPRHMTVGTPDPDGSRIIATLWTASNCTSTWNGSILRIDRAGIRGLSNILTEAVVAKTEAVVAKNDMDTTIEFNRNILTVRATDGMGDGALLMRTGIHRYRIQNGKAIRITPIAVQRGAFIDEWLELSDSQAAQYAEPAAAVRHHQVARMFQKKGWDWDGVAVCESPAPVWEIALRPSDGTPGIRNPAIWFRLRATTATNLRILAISDHATPGCRMIDISDDLHPLATELPE